MGAVRRFSRAEEIHSLVGYWEIYEMELWDEDYFNMETQAYIEIKSDRQGLFQFGLVTGFLDGYLEQIGDIERFSFTWEGTDEVDEASGSGWLKLIDDNDANEAEGCIDMHQGDRSGFKVIRAV